MHSILTFFIFFLSTSSLYSQLDVSGLIVDSTTQEPISFATVYFDGTTNGTISNEEGFFSLSVNETQLPLNLIISHIGYHPQAILIKDTSTKLSIKLAPLAVKISAIEVKNTSRREKTLQEFRSVFLGEDSWGRNAKIKNEEVITFDRDYKRKKIKTSNQRYRKKFLNVDLANTEWAIDSSYLMYDAPQNLKASSTAPLLLELTDLGYELQMSLISFENIYKPSATGYLGYYFFKPKEGFGGKTKKRHRKNRKKAYYGSSLHFLRSLVQGNLAQNGYAIFQKSKDPKTAAINYIPFDVNPFLQTQKDGVSINDLKDQQLTILYYADRKGYPLKQKKWKRAQPIQSNIYIFDQACIIRKDGTFGDNNISFGGEMGSRGAAWLLPSDYYPEE